MILVSATAFGTNAILAKLAYREGLGTSQTLAFRFVLAAFGMWGLALILRQNPLLFERLRLLTLLALGGVFYFAQSLAYFTAPLTLPASRSASSQRSRASWFSPAPRAVGRSGSPSR